LAAGGGTALGNQQLLDAINQLLLPLTTILTPNSEEARRLAQCEDLVEAGWALQAKGADYVLITGTHEASDLVNNQLFMPERKTETFHWQRLPDSYHGSGCTLASAIAALLAQGLDPFTAVAEAQEFTWQSLSEAYQPGQGQHNPNRLFWVES
jgi:hydroxymethylpyrimidine/phosphomethylpyrimidine kinase